MGKAEERDFHDQYVTTPEIRSLESRFYSTVATELENKIIFDFLGDLTGKQLLFYGSGAHLSMIRQFVSKGAQVTAIDISPETIAKLEYGLKQENLSRQCTVFVMDCEKLDFSDNKFDIVFARSIIHHLDTVIALSEIQRVLKPAGKFTAFEPLGTNPIINCYRWLTPKARTSDEHPFNNTDILYFKQYFPTTKAYYLYFFSIGAYFYRMIDSNEKRFKIVFQKLIRLDNFLLKILPGFRYLCWDILLCSTKKQDHSN